MEPLPTTRQCLIWLRLCPADELTCRRQKIAHIVFSMIILIGLIFNIAASLVYCWKFVSIDLGRSIFAFMIVTGQFAIIYMVLVGVILMRHKIGTIFDTLSTIYETSKCSFLNQSNLKLEFPRDK